PLDKGRFDAAFKSFCQKRQLRVEPRATTIDGRQVDLHQLHREIIQEGGMNIVDQKDMWAVIGARLGFNHFPGSEAEPARSGPVVAQQLQHMYKLYLLMFDSWYASQVMEKKIQAHQAGLPPNLQLQIQSMAPLSQFSVAELRAEGRDERVIAFVEQNRAMLQRTAAEER
ncbi:hypothetical protein BDN70DRAFT_772213, partial [Pholiota conissans]